MDYTFFQNFYCTLSIDGNKLIPKNIINCIIREWIFDVLPRIEISLFDDGYLTEVFPIKDDSVLSISFGVNPDDPNIKSAEFNIVDKVIDNTQGNKSQIVSITGILKTNNCFFPIKTRSFKNQTSIQVLEKIGKEIGLKINKNPNIQTTDLMTWLQIGCNNFEFIKHVLKRSYIRDDILFGYADINSNFNLNSFISSINWISKTARYNVQNFTEYNFKDDLDKTTIWYKSFNTVNYTNTFNRNFGYGMKGTYYDFDKANNIELSKNLFPLTEFSYNEHQKETVKNEQFPIYTKNIFKDYYKAISQNKYLKGFFNYSVLLDINALTDVKLFDKVDLIIESLMTTERDEVNSGEYIVGGIIHSFGASTLYRKQLSLHRNGYNTPKLL